MVFAFPIRVMSPAEAAGYRAQLESFEATLGREKRFRRCLKRYPNLVMPFVDEITRRPEVTNAVAEILGDDLLALDAPFFIKEANSPDYVSWHQDLHYWGLDGEDEVTAWIALSPATRESGCMRFVAGSHRKIVDHRETHHEQNMLSRGQEIAVDVNEADTIDAELAPGEMSLHHGRAFHASHPNQTDDRRIGLAIRFLSPRMKQAPGGNMAAMLVRGEDRFGHFRHCRPPSGLMNDEDYAQWSDIAGARESVVMAGASS